MLEMAAVCKGDRLGRSRARRFRPSCFRFKGLLECCTFAEVVKLGLSSSGYHERPCSAPFPFR